MTPGKPKLDALLPVLDRHYRAIREIEAERSVFGAEGDFRPRIESFHDAVRALTAGERLHSRDSRLSVERLAWDVEMLRYIQSKPLTAGRGQQHYAPGTAVIRRPDAPEEDSGATRELRLKLGQLYKDYAVLFTAIFVEQADMNAEARAEELNALVEDCHALDGLLGKLARGEMNVPQVAAAAEHLENDDLRRAVLAHLRQQSLPRGEIAAAQGKIAGAIAACDQEIATIQDAGMRFAAGRLAVYEEAKETVKRLAAAGLNIAGKFVESAAQQQGRGGRGR